MWDQINLLKTISPCENGNLVEIFRNNSYGIDMLRISKTIFYIW